MIKPGNLDDEKDNQLIKIKWNSRVEEILNTWADISLCYKWLHESSYRKYIEINYRYSIPVIILSTLTGTVNVGMAGLVSGEYSSISQIVIGLISIITGVISTLQHFFRYAQISESHFNAYTGWSRLHRNIHIELNLQRKYRKKPGDFVKVCRSEYDRLMEQSPLIPTDIMDKFKSKHGDITKNGGLIIPDNIDNIKHVEIYKDPELSSDTDSIVNYQNRENCKEENQQIYSSSINDIKDTSFEKELIINIKDKEENAIEVIPEKEQNINNEDQV